MNLTFKPFFITISLCVVLTSARLGFLGEESQQDQTTTAAVSEGGWELHDVRAVQAPIPLDGKNQHTRELKKGGKSSKSRSKSSKGQSSKKKSNKRGGRGGGTKPSSSSGDDSSVSSESTSKRSKKKGFFRGNKKGSKKSSSSADAEETEPTLLNLIQERADEFSTFLSLAELAGIDDDLASSLNSRRALAEGGMTIFLPTNTAFDDVLPANLLDKYTDTSAWGDSFLRNILEFHFIEGSTILSTDLEDGSQIIGDPGDVLPSSVTVNTQVDPPQLSGPSIVPTPANIVEVDNIASNGVFHVIDQVLTPAFIRVDLLTAAVAFGGFTTFLDLLDVSDLTETLQGKGPFTVYAVPDLVFEGFSASLGIDFVAKLKENTAELKTILENHIVVGQVFCGCESATAISAAGNPLTIADIGKDGYTVNGVATAPGLARVQVSNAYTAVLTSLLLPPGLPSFLAAV
jgi:uncharacterized surface protein with fasciclin (FAS1) repeats